jgi:hypothetical protein
MFTATSVVVLVKRTEMESTPKIAYLHEVPVLEALHGPNRIVVTDEPSPLGKQELDAETEYQRMLTEYTKRQDEDHPVFQAYKDFEAFEHAVTSERTVTSKRGPKPAKHNGE